MFALEVLNKAIYLWDLLQYSWANGAIACAQTASVSDRCICKHFQALEIAPYAKLTAYIDSSNLDGKHSET